MKSESNLRKELWNRLTPCQLKHLTIRRQTFFLNKIYQQINSYILKYINELREKKTSRESIFEPKYLNLVIVSKADTFDNKAPKEKMLFSF